MAYDLLIKNGAWLDRESRSHVFGADAPRADRRLEVAVDLIVDQHC
jgi:hypothetical protein